MLNEHFPKFVVGELYKIDPTECELGSRLVKYFVPGISDQNLTEYDMLVGKNCYDIIIGLYIGESHYIDTLYYKFLYDNKYYLINFRWLETEYKLKITECNNG